MIPLFGSERKREINLGGRSSSTTHVSILNDAKARREQRQDQKRKQYNATRIQAWWRGIKEARIVRQELRRRFEEDITGITGLRCLVLIGQDEQSLAMWSLSMVSAGEDVLLAPATGSDQASWFVLIKQLSLRLLKSVSDDPLSKNSVPHLEVLTVLLSSAKLTTALGPTGSELSLAMTRHLLSNNMYRYLGQAITRIPVDKKATPQLPLIISLLSLPLPTFVADSIEPIFSHVLTIPLLPNRLPLNSLAELSSRLPLSFIQLLSPQFFLRSLSTESKVHLVANLLAFTTPRYTKIPVAAFEAYVSLLTTILDALPVNALEPPSVSSSKSWSSEADSDDDSTQVEIVESFSKREPLPNLDPKTLKRLQTLASDDHLKTLLTTHTRMKDNLFRFLVSLCIVWPGRADKVLSAVASGGTLVRELYRGYVRSSPLGRDDNPGTLMDAVNASHWPPLLLLTDMYAQALLTMGDDDFFSSVPSANVASRNPLTLDELTSFSRKLLNIAFTLYWRDDQTNVAEGKVPGLNLKWEDAREKVTRCLQGIHARDSRKPFTPPEHWLITSQIDLQSFVEAAVFEEQQISQNGEGIEFPSSGRTAASSRAMMKRQVAYLSPRLGVLNNIPFAIPFEVRVSIFRHFVASDMMRLGRVSRFSSRRGRSRVVVRRDKIAQDGFDKLQEVDLKSALEIVFIDQFGNEEAGIDGGGVFKEFLTSLAKEVFDSDRGLWLATNQNELYPNPHTYAKEPNSLLWYRFIGRVLGKALYEGILVDVAFAGFFLAKWLGRQSFLNDLASLDPELYQGLVFLKHYTDNPEELILNFTVTQEEFGVAKSIELIPNGSNIPVTKANKLYYIYLVSYFKLTKQIKLQSEAFFEGLSDMIDPKWLRMFNQQELQILLGGVDSPIDLDDLRQNTNYGGLYDDHEDTIQAFWRVVNGFNQDQRRALLRFATSCGRPPLLGFKELVPNFAIRDAGSDNERLPTASTCVNLLKLPRYTSETVLRTKLLQAIYSGAGFDLS